MGGTVRRLGLLMFLVLAVACDQGGGTTTTTPTTTTPTTTTPPVPTVEVPTVIGSSLDRAEATLLAADLTLHSTSKYSHEKTGTVLRQDPKRGVVETGTQIEVVVAKAYPRIPSVTGKQRITAQRRLKKADYKVKVVQRRTTTQPDGKVLSQTPKGGSEALPGRVVTLIVANNPCTPGYSPCIPLGPDVDCIGGSGDGPRYTGYHTVSGYDPYGLDSDNDGAGCE